MLNRRKWDETRFHEWLATLSGARPGGNILDLGCGKGKTLGALLTAVGSGGKVCGFDRVADTFAEIEQRYAQDIRRGRLMLRTGDARDLLFPDAIFDAVLCQNVAECVHDRAALVVQAKRVLKPGGTLLLGHHDFDGIIIAGGDPALTRRLVHGYADHQQEWQEACEGQMGRLLPGLVAGAGFAAVEIEARLFVELDLAAGSYARGYIDGVEALAPALGGEPALARRWVLGVEQAAREQRFFFGLPWVGALCRAG